MPAQVMEAPLHQQPLVALPPNTSATATKDMAYHHHGQPRPVNAATAGREQCPRCSSHDTKFCYYNNYNTSQPRHFCRACRRYWTLGGSLRNVPIGGSTRKRPRPTRPTSRAAAFGPFGAPPAPPQPQSLFGSLINSAPLLALGAAPLLQGRLGFDLGLGLPGPAVESTAGEVGLGFGLRGPAGSSLLWPTGFLEHDHVDTWKHHEPAASMWPELPTAAPAEAGGLHHGAQML